MYSRRSALKGVMGVAGGVLAAEGAGAAIPAPSSEGPRSALSLFSNLPAFGATSVVHVADELAGAIPLVLSGPNGHFQVDVCKLSPNGARGVARSLTLDLFVHNGGRGDVATAADDLVALRMLAAELERRERAGAEAPALLDWSARQRLIRGNDYTVDVLTSYLAER